MRTIDWLVIGIIVVIVLLLADGMRRKLRDRRNRVVMKLDRKSIASLQGDEEELLSKSELPNGGARTLVRDGNAPSAPTRRNTIRPQAARPLREAEENSVPVLLDSVDIEEEKIEHTNVFSSAADAEQFAADEFGSAVIPPDDGEEDFDLDEDEVEDWDDGKPANARHASRDDEDDEYDDGTAYSAEEDDLDDELDDLDDIDEALEEDDRPDRNEEFDEEDYDEEYDDESDEDDDDFEDDDDDDFEDDDDYEKEPALLEETYQKAAGHFSRQSAKVAERIEPGFGEDDLAEDFDPADFNESFAENFDDAFDENIDDAEAAEVADTAEETAFRAETRDSAPEPESSQDIRERRSFFSRTLNRQDQAELFNQPADTNAEESAGATPREVIVLNVMARPGTLFEGDEILPVLQENGLRLGDMSIFHRYADERPGQVLFSMANMVKPGTFDLAAMDDFATPGVSFFVQLPNPGGNMASFEKMLVAAVALKQALDGELKDEQRSVCTRQTLEHCRQRIRDFELAQLARR